MNNNNGDAGGNNNNKGRCCQSIKFRLCCTSASMHDRNMDNLSLIIPGGIFKKFYPVKALSATRAVLQPLVMNTVFQC